MDSNCSDHSIQLGPYPPFRSFTPYKVYHINHLTFESTMDYLLEQAKQSKTFTITSKRDSLSDMVALIQVECIGATSVIMLVDCWHLPDTHSYLFHQISRLFSTIFDSTKEIQAWGNINTALLPFATFNLFSATDIQHVRAIDIQQLFREWYIGIFPNLGDGGPSDISLIDEDAISIHPADYDLNLSPLHEQFDYPSHICPPQTFPNLNDDWTLQTAIEKIFQEYLDETSTLSPWGLGLDSLLGTYVPSDLTGPHRHIALIQEKNYRRHLIHYAVTDCLAITALSVPIRNRWSRDQLYQYIQHIHADNDSTDRIHPPMDACDPNLDDELPNITNHLIPISISESSTDTIPQTIQRQLIHADRKKKRSQEAIRRRCQQRNAVKRAHRHDFNIIRTVYRCFKIQQVEQVLNDLHVRRRHCYIRRHYQLHIGLHSYEDLIKYDTLIDKKYFTKSHYDQLFGSSSSSHPSQPIMH